jgi:RNA polymerase-binding transcription factor DksA
MVQPSLAAPRGQRQAASRRLVRQLPALRDELERQRDFREEQLAHLNTHENNRTLLAGYGPHTADADAARALREVRAAVAAGARQALADIERALARISDGTYGRCRDCDADIPLAVLMAIPKATVCLTCRRRSDGTTTMNMTPDDGRQSDAGRAPAG